MSAWSYSCTTSTEFSMLSAALACMPVHACRFMHAGSSSLKTCMHAAAAESTNLLGSRILILGSYILLQLYYYMYDRYEPAGIMHAAAALVLEYCFRRREKNLWFIYQADPASFVRNETAAISWNETAAILNTCIFFHISVFFSSRKPAEINVRVSRY